MRGYWGKRERARINFKKLRLEKKCKWADVLSVGGGGVRGKKQELKREGERM